MKKRIVKYLKTIRDFIKSLAVVQWIMAGGLYLIVRFIYMTNKIEIRGAEHLIRLTGKQSIIVSWHGRSLFSAPFIRRTIKHCAVIASRHHDGQVAARYLHLFGFNIVVGSSGKDGVGALMSGARILKNNIPLCITPDGPRGPRMHMNDGAVYFAKISNAPVVTFCFSCSRPKVFRAWDRHMIPRPFGRIIISATPPMYYDRTNPTEMDDFRIRVETRLNDQLHELDEACGLQRLEPGENKK